MKFEENYFDKAFTKVIEANYKEAISILSKEIKANPSNGIAHCLRAEIRLFNLDDIRGGIDDFLKTIEIHPRHLHAYCSLSYAYCVLHDFEAAYRFSSTAFEINPLDEIAVVSFARVLKHFKMLYHFKEDINRVIEINTKYHEIYNYAGLVNIEDGYDFLALENFNIAIDRSPNRNSMGYLNRGLLRIKKNNSIEEGIEDLFSAYKLGELSAYKELLNIRPCLFFDKSISKLTERDGIAKQLCQKISLNKDQFNLN